MEANGVRQAPAAKLVWLLTKSVLSTNMYPTYSSIPYSLKFLRTKIFVVCQISIEKVIFVVKFSLMGCPLPGQKFYSTLGAALSLIDALSHRFYI